MTNRQPCQRLPWGLVWGRGVWGTLCRALGLAAVNPQPGSGGPNPRWEISSHILWKTSARKAWQRGEWPLPPLEIISAIRRDASFTQILLSAVAWKNLFLLTFHAFVLGTRWCRWLLPSSVCASPFVAILKTSTRCLKWQFMTKIAIGALTS